MYFNKFVAFRFLLFLSVENGLFRDAQTSDDLRSTKAENLSLLASRYGKNFVQGTECGGSLEGIAGVIDYKLGQNLTRSGEVCVWTILVPQKNTIQVEIIEDGFSRTCSNCQIVTILKMNSAFNYNKDELIPHTVITRHPNRQIYSVAGGSLIQISFSSVFNDEGLTGFLLLFRGIGQNDNSTGSRRTNYRIYDPQEFPERTISYQAVKSPDFGEADFVTFTIHPEKNKHVALTLTSLFNYAGYPSGCTLAMAALVVKDFSWDEQGLGPVSRLRRANIPTDKELVRRLSPAINISQQSLCDGDSTGAYQIFSIYKYAADSPQTQSMQACNLICKADL